MLGGIRESQRLNNSTTLTSRLTSATLSSKAKVREKQASPAKAPDGPKTPTACSRKQSHTTFASMTIDRAAKKKDEEEALMLRSQIAAKHQEITELRRLL